MVATLRFVLGDQLSRQLSSLRDLDPARDVVLMAEVDDECTYVRHHPKKIAFVLSAMRHFAQRLRREGIVVDYRPLDAAGNRGSLRAELQAAVDRHRPARVVITEPGEWRLWQEMQDWQRAIGVPEEIRSDDRFLLSRTAFAAWAEGRRQLRMETFYREMRRRTGLLMTASGEPEGGQWNFDKENRKRLPLGVRPPPAVTVPPDELTRAVLTLVRERFAHHFGDLEPFGFAVTAEDAERVFARFLAGCLRHFGDYQDAMRQGERTLFHSQISLYLNVGLLDPLAVCRRVEAAYRAGRAPLNAAEGFIRQIIGWREYVRGIYWLKMPAYAESNALAATRPLPAFYWSGETDMNCLRQCITQTKEDAYAHHIQRLMVTGNFALLAGIAPEEINAWYLAVYADAFEWVELPNTHGMAIHADGGQMASKPYAASGAYINRMSDYCRHCAHDVRDATGERACPFNFLYWDFIARHAERFARNPRMAMPLRSLARMDPGKLAAMRAKAQAFLSNLR